MSDFRFEPWRHKDKRKKTKWWGVFSTDRDSAKAGEIKWLSDIKAYAFCPEDNTGYGAEALKEILVFITNANFLHKELKKKRKKK